MARRVTWTESAWADLEAAAEYIEKDSPRYAAAFVREMRDASRSLANLSERGRIVPEFDDSIIRELLVRSYRMIYRVGDDRVVVLGLIHGARDLQALWDDTQRE